MRFRCIFIQRRYPALYLLALRGGAYYNYYILKKVSIKKLDDIWREKIYAKAGNKCEFCGKTERLNAHHIYSRSNHAVRWYIPNGICLCVSHHVFSSSFSAHKTPMEFVEWIMAERGKKWHDNLLKEKMKIVKEYDYGKILEQLESN